MIERTLYDIIESRLEWFKADDGQRFERFLLETLEVTAAEAAKGRLYFAGGTDSEGTTIEAKPPVLLQGYPRQTGPFPCWTILLGNDQEVASVLNDDASPLDSDGEYLYDPETGERVDPKVRFVSYTLQIMVLSEHPDVTQWYYWLLKLIILSQHDAIVQADYSAPRLSGGDLAPDSRYLPAHLFARQLTVQVDGEETWEEAFEGIGSSIAGIAIDDTGDSKTAGPVDSSVAAGVTSYGS